MKGEKNLPRLGFEPRSPVSKTDMLTIALSRPQSGLRLPVHCLTRNIASTARSCSCAARVWCARLLVLRYHTADATYRLCRRARGGRVHPAKAELRIKQAPLLRIQILKICQKAKSVCKQPCMHRLETNITLQTQAGAG